MRGFINLFVGLGEGHFPDFVEFPRVEAEFVGGFLHVIGLNGFVVEVPVGEVAARLGEGFVVGPLFGQRDTGEHFFQVGGEALRYSGEWRMP
jgi:hypothetical protein